MKNIALSIICIFIILSCENNKKEKNVQRSSSFRYKDLTLDIKNSSDTLQPKDLKQLFGTWTIDSISEIGATMESEKLIQSQIGRNVIISESIFSFSFLNWNTKIVNPHYNFITYSQKNGDNLKATSLFYGYKDTRKTVTFLTTIEKDSYYLEIINDHELVYFYDGRIYFFKKKK